MKHPHILFESSFKQFDPYKELEELLKYQSENAKRFRQNIRDCIKYVVIIGWFLIFSIMFLIWKMRQN